MIRERSLGEKLCSVTSGDKLAASSLSPPPRGLGFTTSLSTPNVSLSKKTLARKPCRGVEILVEVLGIRSHIDAEFFNHALGNRTVRSRTLDRECSAETQAKRITDSEFVALGVAAEIVVVFENKDAALFPAAFR